MEWTKIDLKPLMIVPIIVGLGFTMLINGWELLMGDNAIYTAYLNHYNRTPITDYPNYFKVLLFIAAITQIAAPILFIISIFRKEFRSSSNALYLKWGIFACILSVTFYGFMVRVLSNHNAAANLFFYTAGLYLCLWFVEQQRGNLIQGWYEKIKTLPIYALLIYTLGFPGWQKWFNAGEVMDRYMQLFDGTMLSMMPGGVVPFIYFIGFLELIIPIFLIISLFRKEFSLDKATPFLNLSFTFSIATFIMLCFGLSVVLNYAGATNLIFYAIATLGLYLYMDVSIKRNFANKGLRNGE
ncbi:hypothetical protein M8998_12400 [Sphingobacterium sp. lm-10]|uniref:hypothetical protein n=1 Tax=Sphingobacterium sp. lm-10 TaxID=2944904 RepID=UPI0020212F0D|nr:hypothetical protein [Sphingobacterium sp. lm-10]MCL7988741.1 hypothetical protein [Sphingobacterium sp. lm-10]